MKSIEILPTEDNLINALQQDMIKRNEDIAHFYQLLTTIDGPFSIALDGRWGSGKTFFVRQLVLVINANNSWSAMEDRKRTIITEKLPFKNTADDNSNSHIAVYYDAWENDNDTDPLISIVYEISKQLNMDYDFREKDFCKTA